VTNSILAAGEAKQTRTDNKLSSTACVLPLPAAVLKQEWDRYLKLPTREQWLRMIQLHAVKTNDHPSSPTVAVVLLHRISRMTSVHSIAAVSIGFRGGLKHILLSCPIPSYDRFVLASQLQIKGKLQVSRD